MAFDVGAIVGKLELRKDQWNQSIKQVKADQKSLSGLVLRNSQQFKQMGRTMTVAGTAVVGAVGLMVKAHATFDHAMNESLAIMGDISEATRREMAQTALDMSTKSTFAAKELAEAYFFLASAGMDANQSIKALPVVAKFAQAGAFNLATATDLLTDAQTALGLSSKDAAENQKNLINVSDVLVKANTLANASVQQFSEALTNRAAAALVNVNKKMYEGVAVLAAYADKGVKGQIAGTRLAMMLNALDIAARKNKRAWDENGIALFDAQGEMRSMGDIIGDLEGLLGSMSTEQRSATLAALGFNVRTKASILTLMGSSEKIKQWEKDLKDAGGTTEEVAKKQLQSLVNQFTVLKNQITKAAISVGKTLGPALKGMIEDLKGTVGRVAEWIKAHPKLTEIIAKSAVAVGGLLMVLGSLAMMLPGIIAALPALAAGFTMLLGPIGAVALAAAAVGVAVNKVIDNYKKKQDAEMDAIVKASNPMAKAMALRTKLIKDEVITIDEWAEIFNKHGRSYKRTMQAIATLPEYAYIREQWDKVIDKEEEVEISSDDLTETLREDSEDVVNLTKKMVDEIKKATLNEFEYRTWAAGQTYEERKALLEAEKADNDAFVLLERAHAAELDQIDKDRTQKRQEEIDEQGNAMMVALQKWHEEEKTTREKIQELHAGYTDYIKELTMSEKDYRLEVLDEWYASELEKLGENLEAKAALLELYNLRKVEIEKDYALTSADIAMGIGSVLTMLAGKNKVLAIAGALISTYAGAAKTLATMGMPAAIPFIAMAIVAGLKQVAEIRKQPIPSAEKGAYLPNPTIIEAGHGRLGEVILPLDKAPREFMEMAGTTVEGARINLNFYGPIISTTGLSHRDIDGAAEYFLQKMRSEIGRYGGRL